MRVGLLSNKLSDPLYANLGTQELFDYVGHNTGNLAFLYALTQQLSDQDLQVYTWRFTPDELRSQCDLLVLPCANQLGIHSDMGEMAHKLHRAGVPVVAVGLGAQADSQDQDVTLTAGTARWLRTILDLRPTSAPNIFARGAYSAHQIERLVGGDAVAGCCPSFFISHNERLGQTIAAGLGTIPGPIAVAAGHNAWANCARVEQQLAGLVSDGMCPGTYIVQSGIDMVRLSRGAVADVDNKMLEQIRQHVVPHLSKPLFLEWVRRFFRSFYDVPSWMEHLRNYDVSVGLRYHGVALALQAGKPGLTINVDARTTELCAETGVPNVGLSSMAHGITRQWLREQLSEFDALSYDALRSRKAAMYAGFLRSNLLTPGQHVDKLAKTVPALS